MSTPSTTQAELQNIVNGMVHSKFLQCDSPQGIMNRAVRYVVGDIDLRSSLRSTPLSPNMFSNQYDYASPADLKGDKLVDFRKTVNRPVNERFILIDEKD